MLIISRSFLIIMKNVSEKCCRGTQSPHFRICPFFRKSCRLWDNVEKLLYNLTITLTMCVDAWSYLAHFVLEWKMFQTNIVDKLKAHIILSINVFSKMCRFWDNVEKLLYNLTITLKIRENVDHISLISYYNEKRFRKML
jgi:hypothetical protein